MADNVAGISNTSEESAPPQSRTPSTRNIGSSSCVNQKYTPKSYKRSCGLRRVSSPFVSPVINRCFLSDNQENFDTPKRCRYINSQEHNEIPSPKETGSALHQLQTEKKDLIKIIQEREDSLRKLNLVKMYRNKNDIMELKCLIDKWRRVSQEAAESLLEKIQLDPKPTMSELLSNLQIDKEIMHYSEDNEAFY